MPDEPPYVDTSALASWYVPEARSEEVEAFLRGQKVLAISRLTVLEFRCLIARKGRAGLSATLAREIVHEFENDIREGVLLVHPLEDAHASTAIEFLTRLANHPLRSLDALHLAIAREIGARTLVTADRIMADAARTLGFRVARFD